MSSDDAQAAAWFLFVFGAIAYFIPTIVAIGRKHASAGGIIVLNVLLGWSVIGWIVALAWAFSSPKTTTVVQVQQHAAPPPAPGIAATCSNCGKAWTLAPGQTSYVCTNCNTTNHVAPVAPPPPAAGPTGF